MVPKPCIMMGVEAYDSQTLYPVEAETYGSHILYHVGH